MTFFHNDLGVGKIFWPYVWALVFDPRMDGS